jgi:hypothetical protein
MQSSRAKLFMPFDAMKGLSSALKREEELHEKGINNYDLKKDINNININSKVYVRYYYEFETLELIGLLREKNKAYIVISNTRINIEDIDEIKKVETK